MTVLNLSEYDAALLDKLDHQAEAIERSLHSPEAALFTSAERRNLKDALSNLHARMSGLVNRYGGRSSNGQTS